jgi:hypothetical protein
MNGGTHGFSPHNAWQVNNPPFLPLHTLVLRHPPHHHLDESIQSPHVRQSPSSHWQTVVEQKSSHTLQPWQKRNCLHTVTDTRINHLDGTNAPSWETIASKSLANGGGTHEFAHTSAWQEKKSPSRRYRQWNCEPNSQAFPLFSRSYRGARNIIIVRYVETFLGFRTTFGYRLLSYVKCQCFLYLPRWCIYINILHTEKKCESSPINHSTVFNGIKEYLMKSLLQTYINISSAHMQLLTTVVQIYRDWHGTQKSHFLQPGVTSFHKTLRFQFRDVWISSKHIYHEN